MEVYVTGVSADAEMSYAEAWIEINDEQIGAWTPVDESQTQDWQPAYV